jgi:hypothetical protein
MMLFLVVWKKGKNLQLLYLVPMRTQKYGKKIKNVFLIFGLYPDLAKSSYEWSPLFLHLLMDDCDLGYIQFLKKTIN